jgi:uncharacterized C2H2 Zn-finger protein
MSEECPDCGAVFADPAELGQHLAKAHAGGDAQASMAMNPYSETPGVTCALCGATFATAKELAEHDLKPHPANQKTDRARTFGGANSA